MESTISILRGIKPRYEVRLYACPLHVLLICHVTVQVHHGVEISDGALVTGLSSFTSTLFISKIIPRACISCRVLRALHLRSFPP